jgi:hypothetical protein
MFFSTKAQLCNQGTHTHACASKKLCSEQANEVANRPSGVDIAPQDRCLLYAALIQGLEIVAAGTGPENRAQLIQLLVRFNIESEEVPEAQLVRSFVRRAGTAADLVASGGKG